MADEREGRRAEAQGMPPEEGGAPERQAAEAAGAEQAARAEQLRALGRARRRRATAAVVGVVALVLLAAFVVRNAQPVEVNFVFLTRHPRLIWVMMACAVLGGIVGYVLGSPRRRERRERFRGHRT